MTTLVDLTIAQNKFSIDGIPTEVIQKILNGENDLPKVIFKDINTGNPSYEKSAIIKTFIFNGTSLLTPSAVNDSYDLNVQDIKHKYDQLEGRLLVLDLEHGVSYGAKEITGLLQSQNILDTQGRKLNDNKYIILCRTGLMERVLEIVDQTGTPNETKLGEIQKNRPGFTVEGARFISKLDIAKAYLIDNTSFELQEGAKDGYPVTQHLMNPSQQRRTFIPLIYHIGHTTKLDFQSLLESGNIYARIEFGNTPDDIILPGYSVAIKAYKG